LALEIYAFFTSCPNILSLVEIAMVQAIGYVEDERCFKNMNFYQIQTLQLVNNTFRPCGWMFAQQF
jgi:hypothetical protein